MSGLEYLQNLEYHGILGTVPAEHAHEWGCAQYARMGTINVERVEWESAIAEFAAALQRALAAEAENKRLREALEGLMAAVNRFHPFRSEEPDETCYICPAMRRAQAALRGEVTDA